MNYGRGWNPKLDESCLLFYSEYEAKNITQGTETFHIHLFKVSTPDTSSISRNNESPNMTSFCLLGF